MHALGTQQTETSEPRLSPAIEAFSARSKQGEYAVIVVPGISRCAECGYYVDSVAVSEGSHISVCMKSIWDVRPDAEVVLPLANQLLVGTLQRAVAKGRDVLFRGSSIKHTRRQDVTGIRFSGINGEPLADLLKDAWSGLSTDAPITA